MKRSLRWLKRKLANNTNLSLDVQHWRTASCWKMLWWCIAGCLVVLAIWIGAIVFVIMNPDADPLSVYICGTALVILSLMAIVTLGVRIKVIGKCLVVRRHLKKQSTIL